MPATTSTLPLPKAEIGPPKVDKTLPSPLAARPVELHDLQIRLLGIPAFGVAIPHVTGLFGPLTPADGLFWLGSLYFVALSAAIWHGNRFFLIQQRRYYDWFDHPWRKITLLLFANVFYTAPLSVGLLLVWFRIAGRASDWAAIEVATLACVICVIFITHVYETVYLIQQRESDLLTFERLERARAEAELQALKAQVDPHFLFNSLNTLGHLVATDAVRAQAFTERLAEVYRYLLMSQKRELVPLADELAFAEGYADLLRLRFGDALALRVSGDVGPFALIPPIALQTLLENAVKHNELSAERPLAVELEIADDAVSVQNVLRPRKLAGQPSKQGLRNLDERCRRLTGRGLEIAKVVGHFQVRVPILRTAT
jgi:hypothetical protein